MVTATCRDGRTEVRTLTGFEPVLELRSAEDEIALILRLPASSDGARAIVASARTRSPADRDLLSLIRRLRQVRNSLFGDRLFGEPAWDIMLDLYQASLEGRSISVSSACIASAVPATTALRHLKGLEQAGLVERAQDGADARRVFVRLTSEAIEGMANLFERCACPPGNGR